MGPRAMLLPGGLSYAVKTALASESKNKRIISHVIYKKIFHREISINHIYLHQCGNPPLANSPNASVK